MSAKRRTSHTSRSPVGPDLATEYGQEIRSVSDPLDAETLAAAILAIPDHEGFDADLGEMFVTTLIESACETPSPESAALLRALAAVAPPHQRREAVSALGTVTDAGHYPPEWSTQIGRAVPVAAWRRCDLFEDTETIAVVFRYGEREHALLVQVDRCREPTVLTAVITPEVGPMRELLASEDDPLTRVEQIELADARVRIEEALAHEPTPEDRQVLNETALMALPIARARVRRLPAQGAAAPRRYQPGDRAAAVAEFLASPYAAQAGDEKTARFWAEALAGYSACVPGDPPTRIGTLKLTHVLLSYVPATFALTDELRRGLDLAVTAWTRWAATRHELPEPALAALEERLPEVLSSFDETYDAPDVALVRGYLSDLSATTTDAAILADALARRALAVPVPDERGEERTRWWDATDPALRRAIVEAEYTECEPSNGMSQQAFLAAVVEVSEQLWQDEPPEQWQRAEVLLDAGVPPHDVLHQLVSG